MTPEIGIYDHTTGENLVREMTKDELAEYKAGLQATAKAEAAQAKAEADKAALLVKLGITAQEAALLVG